jgi:hypothetical protein
MYYEIMTNPTKTQMKREFVMKNKEKIISIVNEMLQKDAPIAFNNYDIYKEPFMTFAQDVIEKYTLLNEPRVEYMIPDPVLIDKNLMIHPKTKRTIVEIMKKYNDNV